MGVYLNQFASSGFVLDKRALYLLSQNVHVKSLLIGAISRSSQCSTTGVTKAVVCDILSVGWCI